MGWWSCDIMGGDTPYDYVSMMFDICGVEQFPEDDSISSLSPKNFSDNLTELVDVGYSKECFEPDVWFQVLGFQMMEAGAEMSEGIKMTILDACDADEWAKERKERKEHIDKFKLQVKQYENKPVELEHKGLFQKIYEGEFQ